MPKAPTWSDDDETYLNDAWGRLPDTTVAGHLHRTVTACYEKARRLGIMRKMNVYTARAVAEIFGVDSKTIATWCRRGWLAGRRSPIPCGVTRMWDFDPDDLERFVRERPWAYDRSLMAEGDYLTLLAARVAKADPWLTCEEAARAVQVCAETVRRWCREGLPHQHRPTLGAQHGPWAGRLVIRQADLLSWRAQQQHGAHARRSAAARARMLRRAGRAA